jgi:ribonuclease P protein component
MLPLADPVPAVSPAVVRMTLRTDYLRAAQGLRQGTPAFLLQARARDDADPAVRVGLTCSRKVGNAVARNRAKRRLRALVRAVLPAFATPGWDYVLVGRPDTTAARAFGDMQTDLARALAQIHAKAQAGAARRRDAAAAEAPA